MAIFYLICCAIALVLMLWMVNQEYRPGLRFYEEIDIVALTIMILTTTLIGPITVFAFVVFFIDEMLK